MESRTSPGRSFFVKMVYICHVKLYIQYIMRTKNFVAVDVELFTRKFTSVCAIGMVRVRDGVITQKFYSLVKPVKDEFTDESPNTWIHGITKEMIENAPTFDKLIPVYEAFVGDLPVVCHNASTEANALLELFMHYNHYCYPPEIIDTRILTDCSLEDACKKYNIEIGEHHNALDDALACAKIYMATKKSILVIPKPRIGKIEKDPAKKFANRHLDSKVKETPDLDSVENKDTIFFGKKVVITGIFEAYPDRNVLAAKIQSLGGDINSTISGKTNIVLMGEGAGPSKIKKIEDQRAKGVDIKIIQEEELKEILRNQI